MGGGNNRINGHDGDDVFEFDESASGLNLIAGSAGNDSLRYHEIGDAQNVTLHVALGTLSDTLHEVNYDNVLLGSVSKYEGGQPGDIFHVIDRTTDNAADIATGVDSIWLGDSAKLGDSVILYQDDLALNSIDARGGDDTLSVSSAHNYALNVEMGGTNGRFDGEYGTSAISLNNFETLSGGTGADNFAFSKLSAFASNSLTLNAGARGGLDTLTILDAKSTQSVSWNDSFNGFHMVNSHNGTLDAKDFDKITLGGASDDVTLTNTGTCTSGLNFNTGAGDDVVRLSGDLLASGSLSVLNMGTGDRDALVINDVDTISLNLTSATAGVPTAFNGSSATALTGFEELTLSPTGSSSISVSKDFIAANTDNGTLEISGTNLTISLEDSNWSNGGTTVIEDTTYHILNSTTRTESLLYQDGAEIKGQISGQTSNSIQNHMTILTTGDFVSNGSDIAHGNNSVIINSGTLNLEGSSISSSGDIDNLSGGRAIFSGVTMSSKGSNSLSNSGTIDVSSSGTLGFENDTFANTSVLNVNANNSADNTFSFGNYVLGDLKPAGSVNINDNSGSKAVNLSSGASDFVIGSGGTSTVITIENTRELGASQEASITGDVTYAATTDTELYSDGSKITIGRTGDGSGGDGLQINGNLTMAQPNAILDIEIGSTTSTLGNLDVVGNADLEGRLHVHAQSGFSSGSDQTLVNVTSGSLSADFGEVLFLNNTDTDVFDTANVIYTNYNGSGAFQVKTKAAGDETTAQENSGDYMIGDNSDNSFDIQAAGMQSEDSDVAWGRGGNDIFNLYNTNINHIDGGQGDGDTLKLHVDMDITFNTAGAVDIWRVNRIEIVDLNSSGGSRNFNFDIRSILGMTEDSNAFISSQTSSTYADNALVITDSNYTADGSGNDALKDVRDKLDALGFTDTASDETLDTTTFNGTNDESYSVYSHSGSGVNVLVENN